jgi:hypothetical protein
MKNKGKIGIIVMKPHWEELNNVFYARIREEIEYFGYQSEILNYDKFYLEIKTRRCFITPKKNSSRKAIKCFF